MLSSSDFRDSQRRLESRGREAAERARQKAEKERLLAARQAARQVGTCNWGQSWGAARAEGWGLCVEGWGGAAGEGRLHWLEWNASSNAGQILVLSFILLTLPLRCPLPLPLQVAREEEARQKRLQQLAAEEEVRA